MATDGPAAEAPKSSQSGDNVHDMVYKMFTHVKNTSLLESEELHQYILKTSVYPGNLNLSRSYGKQQKFLYVCFTTCWTIDVVHSKADKCKKTIEVGVYTGYSLLRTALSIPNDGKIIAIDVDKDVYEIGLPFIRKAGVEHKINFILSDAQVFLDNLLQEEGNEGSYDFSFVDADKQNYKKYHERLIKLVKVGGILAYDNTLWGGSVAMPESKVQEFMRSNREVFIQLNELLAADPRVEIVQLPLGDGITFCRRLY